MRLLARAGQRLFNEPAIVLYDGSCKLCRRSVGVLKAMDLLEQVVAVNALDDEARTDVGPDKLEVAQLMQAMHVVTGQRVWSGFEACRMLASRTPLLWPVYPFLYIWPIPGIGRRVYRWVAASRTCAPARTPRSTVPPSDVS